MTTGIQKRLRVEFETAVILTTSNMKPRIAITRNISLNGIYAESSRYLPVGDECLIELIVTGNDPLNSIRLHIRGKIVRTDKDGVGITFTAMSDRTQSELKKLILYNSDQPSLFLRQCENNPGFL
jgi:hypothetical protein